MILSRSEARDPAVAGGKAAALARLAAEGFDVPDFIVLTDAAFGGEAGRSPVDGLEGRVAEALGGIGPGPYAVRSSARDEDGALNSHAGQFDTLLNIGAEGVVAAAGKVRASGAAETVGTYRAARGLDAGQYPAVLVQRMVPARAAGIAFSADPVSGRRDRVVVSATDGLGDRLVGGEIDGESWTLDRSGNVIAGPDAASVLSPEEAGEVAALALRAEDAAGRPQDIEWAFDGDRLRLLQSRPITTGLRPRATPDDTLVVLDNSNIVESYPGLVTPLTFSFASYCYDRVYRAFVALLGLPERQIAGQAAIFRNLLARVDCRVYYNLGNWYRALALLPGFSLNRDFMETMMGVSEPLPAELTDRIVSEAPSGAGKAVEVLRLARVGAGLIAQAVLLGRTKRRFLERLEASITSGPDLGTATLTDLAATYRRIEASLLDRWDAPLVNDFLCMIGFGASRKLLGRWAGEPGLAFHNDIMIGQGDIISAEPAQRIARMARLVREQGALDALDAGRDGLAGFPDIAREFDDYIVIFGDRCTQELKLESIPLSDDPSSLLAAVRAGAMREASETVARAVPDWAAILPGQPVRRAILRAFCGWAGARVRDRENLRFERTRIFGHARRVFLAIGREFHALGWLDDPRDVFFLTVEEVLGAIEGAAVSPNLGSLAALRKAEMAEADTRPDPPERIALRGAVASAAAVPTTAAKAEAGGDTRTGTGCSAGTVAAVARVISDPRTQSLAAGEILVARNTDPGWIAVFANASAIVVERGSLLSHSAIVAREMGIPCVVGVGDATRWVTDGERLEVDGATGQVRKLP